MLALKTPRASQIRKFTWQEPNPQKTRQDVVFSIEVLIRFADQVPVPDQGRQECVP